MSLRSPSARDRLMIGLSFIACGGMSSLADVINVPGDQPTLSAAVAAAQAGDEIVLADGVYTSTNDLNVEINLSLTIRSASGDPNACVFDYTQNPGSLQFRAGSTGSVVEGIGIRNFPNFAGPLDLDGEIELRGVRFVDNAAIRRGFGAVTMTDCVLLRTALPLEMRRGSLIRCAILDSAEDGVNVRDGATLTDCSIRSAGGAGLVISSIIEPVVIEGCEIRDCGGSGIELTGPTEVAVLDCDILDNGDVGIDLRSGTLTVQDCRIERNLTGVRSDRLRALTMIRARVADNRDVGILVQSALAVMSDCVIQGNAREGVLLISGASASLSDCRILENEIGLACIRNVTCDVEGGEFTANEGPAIDALVGVRLTVQGSIIQGTNDVGVSLIDSEAEFENVQFVENGASSLLGGGLLGVASEGAFRQCEFLRNGGNTGAGDGAYWTGGSLLLEGCVFTDSAGEGLFVAGADVVVLEGCAFSGNTSRGATIEECAVEIVDCVWNANRAGLALSAVTGIVSDSTFTDNTGTGLAGAIEVERCLFARNESGLSMASGAGTVKSSIFEDNSQGGAALTGSDVLVEDCRFERNAHTSANPRAGGLTVSGTRIRVRDCHFIDNVGVAGGGMLVESNVSSESVSIVDCEFRGNQAGSAAALLIESSVDIARTRFIENTTEFDFSGAVGVLTQAAVFESCSFEDNIGAALGVGDLVTTNASAIARRSTFTGNTRNAVRVWNGARCLLDRCDLRDNRGGAAVRDESAESVTLLNCVLSGNRGPQAGAVESRAGQDTRLINCLMVGNGNASTKAGAVFANGSVLTLTNCTVVDNLGALAGGLSLEGATADLHNTIIWNNVGGAIAEPNAPSNITATFSLIEGGFPGVGNLDLDPLFEDPNTGGFALGAGSPAIDAGDNSRLPADFADLDCDRDLAESLSTDLAGNARRFDVPATADTGAGDAPIVDIGAYEAGATPPMIACFGDLDGDDAVGLSDLAELLAGFGVNGAGDIDCDGQTGLADLAALLAVFGDVCQ